ncbi:MAG: hypothetical protein R6V49_02845, partial [Bacteroidales bacterium]
MTTMTPHERPGLLVRMQHGALIALAFAVVLPHKWPHPFFYAFALLWIAEIIINAIEQRSLKFLRQRFVSHGPILLRVSLFLLIFCYIAGVFYSENLASARFELEKKSLLLLFPLAIMTMNQKVFTKLLFSRILMSFAAGLLLFTFLYAGLAIQRYLISGKPGEFFYLTLSTWHHPGYLSFYVVFAMGACLWLFLNDKNRKPWKAMVYIMLSLWWLVFVFLLSSKVGFLSL